MAQLKTGTTIAGNTAWHAGNDGPGSTLDADTLDGQHAAAFATDGHSHTESDITDLDHFTISDANSAIDSRVDKAFVDALNVDADTLDGNDAGDFATSAQGTLADSATQPGDDISTLTNDAGYITSYTVTEDDVTAHQAALSITESQISNLDHFTTTDANSAIDARVDKAFVDALDVDADTLDGIDSTGFATSGHDHDSDYVELTGDTMTGQLMIRRGVSDAVFRTDITGFSGSYFEIVADGAIRWGGGGSYDTLLSRVRTGALELDGELDAGGLSVNEVDVSLSTHLHDSDYHRIDSGYLLLTTLYYTTVGDTTFVKGDYPGLRAIRVTAQGGGGGGKGSNINNAGGAGGGGGACASGFILGDALNVVTGETVTVGAGGAGGVGAGDASNGGVSSFGTHVVGNGGERGGTVATYGSGRGGAGGTGDIIIAGSSGGSVGDPTLFTTGGIFPGGLGGSSHLGGGGDGSPARAANRAGGDGRLYGGGGGGAFCRNASVDGGAGAAGIVIVEVYV